MYLKKNLENLTTKKNKINNIVDAILALSIVSESVFFCFNSLLGYVYLGSQASITYKVYLAVITTFNIALLLFSFIKKPKMPIKYYLMILIPIFFCIFGTMTSLFYQKTNSNAQNTIQYILIWQTTAILAAINIERRNNFICLLKWFDIAMLICTIGLLRAIINSNSISPTLDTIGGATYQMASYYVAFAFGLNLFYLVVNGKYTFKWLSCRIFKIIRLVLLIIQFLASILSGGRGGVVLAFVYVLYFALVSKNKKIILKWKVAFIISIGIFTAFVAYPTVMQNQIFQARLARIFSYVTNSGLDFSKTSGRDIIYKSVIEAILQRPIFGRGILSYFYVYDTYPHNIFIEILFEGGLFYLALWIFIAVKLILKIHITFNDEPEKTFINVIALYPFVFLMFSGSYIINPMLWFVITWAVSKSKNKRAKSMKSNISVVEKDEEFSEKIKKEFNVQSFLLNN